VQAYLKECASSYSLPEADVSDIIGQVLAALWARRGDVNPPDNLSRLLGLARVVFEGKLVDYFRRKEVDRRRRVDAPRIMGEQTGRPEGAPLDPPNPMDEVLLRRSITPEDRLEAKEQLAFVNEQVEMGVITHDDIEVMQAQRVGERSFEELAAERGVAADTLRQRIHRVRQRMIKAWLEYSLFTKTWTITLLILLFLVVVTVIVAALRRKEPPPPLPEPPPAPTQTQSAAPLPPQPAPAPLQREKEVPEKGH
jgi:RNA polymerase sigma factor (sigma-70 family)